MKIRKKKILKCKACGYEWKARVSKPKKCPNPKCQVWAPSIIVTELREAQA